MAERRKDMGKLGKHDHKLTNLLKGGIFSLIMLAPLIAIGVRCLYVVNNKNAKDSYSGQHIYQEYHIDNIDQMNTDLVYNMTYLSNATSTSPWNDLEYISLTNTDLGISEVAYDSISQWRFNSAGTINLRNASGTIITSIVWDNQSQYYKPKLTTFSFIGTISATYFNFATITRVIYTQDKLDNVFEYSVKQLEYQSTFNWVQNTAIYVPLNAMCSGLGITESAIPILLCYWSLMTAIYIVFDIIIYLFTKMTHFIGTN